VTKTAVEGIREDADELLWKGFDGWTGGGGRTNEFEGVFVALCPVVVLLPVVVVAGGGGGGGGGLCPVVVVAGH